MMYNKFLAYILFLVVALAVNPVRSYSQDNIPKELYTANGIPDSLKVGANSVLRYGMRDVTVDGPGKKVTKVHTIVTVLNEKANYEAGISLPYNRKFAELSSFEMLVYDSTGKVIKKYHKGDMYEHGAEEEDALVTDDRVMDIGHTIASYPTTIEMIYEIDVRSLINLDAWRIEGEDQSIQNCYYRISINNDAGFRYLDKNTSIKPQKVSTGNIDAYTWQVSNLKAIKLEDGAMYWRVLPSVEFAAKNFEYYGIPGDLSSWQNYGKWQQGVNADVCNLSPQRIAEIKEMTAGIKTDKEKAKFLYEYMQKNMRYVYIQLGIGGLKPFDATFVDQKKYGDCKALSNYMCALLKAVNITGYYTLVSAGTNEEPANTDFPYDNFDHIIVCVPFKGDTTWLECTNNITTFGTLSSSTENRNALLITEDGGKLVNTPKSFAQENQLNSETHIVLDQDGGAKAQIKFLSTGEDRELFLTLSGGTMDQQKEYLINNFNIKQPISLDLTQLKDTDGRKEVDVNLEYDKFCDIAAGDKLFYRPHAFELWSGTVPILEKRKSDYYFDYPFQRSCVTTIDLPAGFEVETLPADQSLKFTYGNYEVKYVYDAVKNQVISTAKFNLNSHVIPAAKYNEMQQYLDAVAKAQNKKLVIRKKA